MTTKTYTSRDSATSMLRKMGIDKSHYPELITKDKDGFTVDITKAEQILNPPKIKKLVPKTETATEAPTKAKGSKPKPTKGDTSRRGRHDRGRTVSSVARELIIQGLTNNEVYSKLVDEFNLDASKKYYPAWYRSELRGKGFKV